MQKLVAERLPEIGPEVSRFLKGTLDFVGINHYTTLYARNDRIGIRKFIMQDASTDSGVITTRKDAKTSFYQFFAQYLLNIGIGPVLSIDSKGLWLGPKLLEPIISIFLIYIY